MESSKFNYIKASQPGGEFYYCALTAKDLIGLTVQRAHEAENGVQRSLDESKMRDLRDFIRRGDFIFPTPIIISAKSSDYEITESTIKPKSGNSYKGHVIDGQHRLYAIQSLANYDDSETTFPVAFAFDIDIYSEAKVFVTINANQKPVNKSILYRLFSIVDDRSERKSAHHIVASLAADPASSLHGRIKIYGFKIEDKESISLGSMADAVCTQMKKQGSPFFELYKSEQDWVISKAIDSFYKGVSMALQEFEGEGDAKLREKKIFSAVGSQAIVTALNEIMVSRTSLPADYFSMLFARVMKYEDFDNFTPSSNSAAKVLKEWLLRYSA